MKIGVLGTGTVGQVLATKFSDLGHDVTMGSRTKENEKLIAWQKSSGGKVGTFNEAAGNSEILINATNGINSLDALSLVERENLDGKVLIDLANELEIKDGRPVSLASSDNCLAIKIQNSYPELKVIKTLNTINCHLMINPKAISNSHNVFLSGNDLDSKEIVRELLGELGWSSESIVDLGGIESAIGPEMYMAFWLTMFMSGNFGEQAMFNINVVS